jgi:two-component system, cell cycle sensor histidine kinase and response regulator CckA
MSGKKCLERLLKIDPKVKVIIASGYSASDEGNETLRLGAKDFVSKPYDMQKLLQTVRHVLGSW